MEEETVTGLIVAVLVVVLSVFAYKIWKIIKNYMTTSRVYLADEEEVLAWIKENIDIKDTDLHPHAESSFIPNQKKAVDLAKKAKKKIQTLLWVKNKKLVSKTDLIKISPNCNSNTCRVMFQVVVSMQKKISLMILNIQKESMKFT